MRAARTDPLGVRYRASLALGVAGPWRVTVSVAGTDGSGALTFPVDVEPASGSRWASIALGIAGVAGVAAFLLARRRRRLAGVAAALLLLATPAWPHASLVRSNPARRATLTASPDRVQLWFNEAIEPRFSGVSVWDAGGQQVDLRDARVELEDPEAPDRRAPRPSRGAPTGSGSACSRSTATSSRASSRSRCADA